MLGNGTVKIAMGRPPGTEAPEDGSRLGHRGLGHHHGLEASLQRGVLLDVLGPSNTHTYFHFIRCGQCFEHTKKTRDHYHFEWPSQTRQSTVILAETKAGKKCGLLALREAPRSHQVNT